MVDTEPEWNAYIDQEVLQLGANKIRTWFARARHHVGALFVSGNPTGSTDINVGYWQSIEQRITYALETYPWVQLHIIPYGEDEDMMVLAQQGNAGAQFIAEYTQARFAAFPNVHYCLVNDRDVPGAVRVLAPQVAAREPWGTLLTSHQQRGSGYDFVNEAWSDLVTLQTLDEFKGAAVRQWRSSAKASGNIQAVMLDEDRYELHRTPEGDHADWFRRFFWATLVSGGHPTYGHVKTWEAYGGCCSGVRGYVDSVNRGIIDDGGRDLKHIPKFFEDVGVSMVGLEPDLSRCGNNGGERVCSHDADTMVVYVSKAASAPSAVLHMPSSGPWAVTCWDPVAAQVTQQTTATGTTVAVQCLTSSDDVLIALQKV